MDIVRIALEQTKKLLDVTRNPVFLGDVPHTYTDKYTLVETMTNAHINSSVHLLTQLGIQSDVLRDLVNTAKAQSVVLRFDSRIQVTFNNKRTVTKAVGPGVKETKNGTTVVETQLTNTVEEYMWDVQHSFALGYYVGGHSDNCVSVVTRETQTTTYTLWEHPPQISMPSPSFVDLDITVLLSWLGPNLQGNFRINRDLATCCTPRRNEQVEAMLEFAGTAVRSFIRGVHGRLSVLDIPVPNGPTPFVFADIHRNRSLVFNPVSPLMDATNPVVVDGTVANAGGVNHAPPVGVCFNNASDHQAFQSRFQASVAEFLDKLESGNASTGTSTFVPNEVLKTFALIDIMDLVSSALCGGTNLVETQLYKQLSDSLGKSLLAGDFDKLMVYHNRHLFLPAFRPRGFSHEVRAPARSPAGTVQILSGAKASEHVFGSANGPRVPVHTFSNRYHHTEETPLAIRFPLNSSVSATVTGDHVLHGLMLHRFSQGSNAPLSLIAAARQFSSFILLLGKMQGRGDFAPTHGLVVKNKDVVMIPLNHTHVPTAKEFRDSISSLSPEQQAFAKAFREMQLGTSVFAMCVIPVKPLLERVLGLSDGALTKEIELTEALLKLFSQFQIPVDMMAYSGSQDVSFAEQVADVKKHVANVFEMINGCKRSDFDEHAQAVEYANYNGASSSPQARCTLFGASTGGGGFGSASHRGGSSLFGGSANKGGGLFGNPNASTACALMPPEVPIPADAAARLDSPPCLDDGLDFPPQEADNMNQSSDMVDNDDWVDEDLLPESQRQRDYTKIPRELESRLDSQAASVRPTTVEPGQFWDRFRMKSLLEQSQHDSLSGTELENETRQAMDLLDALSRSGDLELTGSTLHVVVAATHFFDETLVNTVVQQNINPVVPVEASSLAFSSVVTGKDEREMVARRQGR